MHKVVRQKSYIVVRKKAYIFAVCLIIGALTVGGGLGIAGVSPAAIAAPVRGWKEIPDPLKDIKEDTENTFIPKAADRYLVDGQYQIPRPKPEGVAKGKIVRGLEEFYAQNINWGPCEDFDTSGKNLYTMPETSEAKGRLQCGYLIVPVDYANPKGVVAALAIMKLAATGAPQGSIFINPGGPGVSSISMLSSLAQAGEARDLNQKFNFIALDSRGVGSSVPSIRCQSFDAFDKQREASDVLTYEKGVEVLQYNTNACYRNTGREFGISGRLFLDNIGTKNVVRDYDIARSVVGDEKMHFLGFSHGTLIGYKYAEQFGDSVGSMVLDGAVNVFKYTPEEEAKYIDYMPKDHTESSAKHAQIISFQNTFNQFLKTCSEDNGFVSAGVRIPCAVGISDDVSELLKRYQTLIRRAYGTSRYTVIANGQERVLSFADIIQGTMMTLYSKKKWPLLNQALYMLRNGDGSFFMQLADIYYARDANGQYAQNEFAFKVIHCADAGGGKFARTKEENEQFMLEKFRLAPFTDPGLDERGVQRGLDTFPDFCSFFNSGEQMQTKTLKGLPNILVISTTYDSATPYHNGVVMAAALGGTLLTVSGTNHTAYLRGATRGRAVEQIVHDYFVDNIVREDLYGDVPVRTLNIYSQQIFGRECSVHKFNTG